MHLRDLQKHWNKFGKLDPLWAIATWPEKQGNKWKKDEFFETGEKEIEEVMAYSRTLNIPVTLGRALDFGCGVGRLTQALAKYFDQVVGVDIAPSMVDLAKQYNRHGAKCQYYLNETDDLKMFPSNSFNFIYTNIVLQHMLPSYAMSYMREFLRVLTPHGLLIFQVPSERLEDAVSLTDRSHEAQNEKRASIVGRVKGVVKKLMPASALELYIRVRYEMRKGPVMEMHCIRREEVEVLLKNTGAQILNIVEDGSAGSGFKGFRYAVTKS